MTRLEKLLAPVGNFRVKLDRYSTIWGGASLLQMIFSCIKNVADSDWADKWDILVNLSESDMPVLPMSDLEAVLSKYVRVSFIGMYLTGRWGRITPQTGTRFPTSPRNSAGFPTPSRK
jgi:hypothetical protein